MSIGLLNSSSEKFSAVTAVSHLGSKSAPAFDVSAVKKDGFWVARSNQIPGLNLECSSLIELIEEIREWGPELLIDNGVIRDGQRFTIVIHSPTAATRVYN